MGNRLLFNLLFFLWSMALLSCSTDNQVNETEVRGFDQEYLEKLNKLDSYDYDRAVTEKSSENPLLEFLAKLFSGLAWFLNSVFGYLIIAFLFGLLIWVLAKNSERFFEKKKLPEKEKLITVAPTEVEEKDYHRLIKAALKKQDYRMAIRFGFLSCLKYLHKKELIEWTIDKTNLDYQIELPENYQDSFSSMLMIYERIWYGDFAADKTLFDVVTRKFHDLKNTEIS